MSRGTVDDLVVGKRSAQHRYVVPECGMSAPEEDAIHELMGRVRRGTLTRQCLVNALRDVDVAKRGLSASSDDSQRLASVAKVYAHVLKFGEFVAGSNPRANPQLQIIENPQLQVIENPAAIDMPSHVAKEIELFHGTSKGQVLLDEEFKLSDNDGRVNELGYCGHCPWISWESNGPGSEDHEILVDKDLVKFHGFRIAFRGTGRPVLCKDLSKPGKAPEGVIVGGQVAKLKKHLDENGKLGRAYVVEYVVDMDGSSKGDDHYVHEFKQSKRSNAGGRATRVRPDLVWDDGVNGLRYVGGVYRLSDWFHD